MSLVTPVGQMVALTLSLRHDDSDLPHFPSARVSLQPPLLPL